MALELARIVLLVSGLLMVVLAIAILAAGAGRPLNRAFAALVGIRGVAVALPQLSTDQDWVWASVRAQPYFVLALVPLILYCIHHLLPRRLLPERVAGWAAVGGIAALDLAYMLKPSLFHSLAPALADPAIGALRAAQGIAYTGFGFLAAVAALVGPLLGILALTAAIAYRREPDARRATTLFLAASGLVIGSLFDASNRLVAFSSLLGGPSGYPWMPWGWAVAALPVLTVFPAAAGAAVVAAPRGTRFGPITANVILGLAGLAFSAGFMRVAFQSAGSDPAGSSIVLILLGISRLLMPVLLAVAFLRHDADGRRPEAADPVAGQPVRNVGAR